MLRDVFERGMRPFFASPCGDALPTLPPELGEFPDICAAFLEFRLGNTSDSVDFAWSQFRRDCAVPPAIAGGEPWRTMVGFGARWRAGAPEFAPVRTVIYEIDQHGGRFGMRPAIFFHRIKADTPAILTMYRATNDMLGRSSSGAEATLALALGAAPPGSVPLCIGYMLSRPDAPLRFVISQIEALKALPDYLRAIGWPGDVADIGRVLAALPRTLGDLYVGLSLDIGDGIGHRLGVELTFKSEPDRTRVLPRVLDELIAAGLCGPAYRETLAAWTRRPACASEWLRELASGPEFHRTVSHFKIVFGPAIETKCYLACMPLAMYGASRRQERAAASLEDAL